MNITKAMNRAHELAEAEIANHENKRKPNRKGCIPTEDVCLEHDVPLICRHGCGWAIKHKCPEADRNLKEKYKEVELANE